MVLLVVSMLGATLVTLGKVEYTISANYRSKTSAVHLADSALEATLADLKTDFAADPSDNWLDDWLDTGVSPPVPYNPFPDLDGTQVNGMTLTRLNLNPNPYPGTPYSLGVPEPLGSGTYERIIWLPPTVTPTGNGTYRVDVRTRAMGTDNTGEAGSSVIVDAVTAMELTTTSTSKSALFFGTASGGSSGGTLQVAGSMHILGKSKGKSKGKSVTKVQFGSGSRQVNSYDGIDDPVSALGPLSSKLPPIETVDFNGEMVASLEAVLRLKDAELDMGKGGSLGEADFAGDSDKETLDAIYSDGTIPSSPGSVNADLIDSYDSSSSFPSLSDPYTDPDTGVYYPTYAAWLDANSFHPITGGDLVIDDQTASFSYIDPGGKGTIEWDADTQRLTVDGIVKINGRVEIGGKKKKKGESSSSLTTVEYDGDGVIYATDDVKIFTDLYPAGDYLRDGPDPDTEIDGNLGLITPRDIEIGSSGGGTPASDLRIMAALYAERKIRINGSVNIAGAAATGELDLRSGSSLNLWQVPLLSSLYPSGMPEGEATNATAGSIEAWYQFR